ncbi:MAG: virulence RhuM family protein [Cytophagaceae bacterium]|jgi:hypothetical protein|nr:virulence RhuM family protein [Cytophagaceae bacterium]
MKNKKKITIRSSAAEYLTFIAATGDNPQSIEMRYEDENIWLTQKLLATLYDVEVHTINYHIKKIFEDRELEPMATIRNFRIVQMEGSRQVAREVEHYNLQTMIAVGFKVNNQRAVQFRKWANSIVKDYTIQGWVMDTDRLKNGGTMLTKDYFEKQLEKIREIRLSERRFYQKVTDIYATALDYDKTSKITYDFFSSVQNKLHWAIHQHTAAELIVSRADAKKIDMGLTSWQDAPEGKIKKSDVIIAKNYLSENELFELERIVSAYLDLAETMAHRGIPMTMQDWNKYLSEILKLNKYEILNGKGRISAEEAKLHAESEFEKYRITQDALFESDYDKFLKLEEEVKNLEMQKFSNVEINLNPATHTKR